MKSVKSFNTIFLIFALSIFFVSCDETTPFTTLDGKTIRISDYKGKTILVPVFSSWCGHCRNELPRLNKLFHDRKNKIMIIGIGTDKKENVEKLVNELKIDFPIINLDNRKVEEYFHKVTGFPTVLIFNKKGKFAQKIVGEKPEGEFEKILDNINHKVSENSKSCE